MQCPNCNIEYQRDKVNIITLTSWLCVTKLLFTSLVKFLFIGQILIKTNLQLNVTITISVIKTSKQCQSLLLEKSWNEYLYIIIQFILSDFIYLIVGTALNIFFH